MADTLVSFPALGGTKEYLADGGEVDEGYSYLFPKVLTDLSVYIDNVLVENAFSAVPVLWIASGYPLYYAVPDGKILKLVATGECKLHLRHTGTLTLQ